VRVLTEFSHSIKCHIYVYLCSVGRLSLQVIVVSATKAMSLEEAEAVDEPVIGDSVLVTHLDG